MVSLVGATCRHAIPLKMPGDLKPLIERIASSRIVMLGESTHGTHEFYDLRRIITEWLIVKHDFNLIAVEGDWPPCLKLNRYIYNHEGDSARQVLSQFKRWPTWMWANTDIIRLAEWLKTHNLSVPNAKRAQFFGLDVYSLFESIDVVLEHLEAINPFMARRARSRYSCFDPFDRDERKYVRSLFELPEGCEQEVLGVLNELLKLRLNGLQDREEALFDAQQNARIIRNAENYYRAMTHADEHSWNIRDRHMLETLDILLNRMGPGSKAIVWAHNTHIGDYRATDMLAAEMINIGGLAREKYDVEQVSLVGFGTYEGEVIASHAWDGPTETMRIPHARFGSYEQEFHQASEQLSTPAFALVFDRKDMKMRDAFSQVRGHRAIGVVYDPEHERWSNYMPTSLYERYDAFIHVDRSTAIEPLIQEFEREEIPETWPAGQ